MQRFIPPRLHIQSYSWMKNYATRKNYPENVQYALWLRSDCTNPQGEESIPTQQEQAFGIRRRIRSFDLLFDSQKAAQAYVDRYKQSVRRRKQGWLQNVNFALQPSVIQGCRAEQHTGCVKAIVVTRWKTASFTSGTAQQIVHQTAPVSLHPRLACSICSAFLTKRQGHHNNILKTSHITIPDGSPR